MMKRISLVILIALAGSYARGQSRYIDRSGKVSFFSAAPLENIEAHNPAAMSIIDTQTGEIVVSVLMKSFRFEKALMQEHFNEKYVESDKYPKASFKGHITNLNAISLTRNGTCDLQVEGEMTIHGITQNLLTIAKATVSNGAIEVTTKFPLKVKDFNIDIPTLLRDNIAETVEVTAVFHFKPMNP